MDNFFFAAFAVREINENDKKLDFSWRAFGTHTHNKFSI
jgi:hypothetical protein